MKLRYLLGCGVVAFGITEPVEARSLFEGSVTVENSTAAGRQRETATINLDRLENLVDLFSANGLQGIASSYNDNSRADASISLRGVPATLSYAENSPVLRLVVPGAGIDRSFAGATRDESRDLAERWFRGQGSEELTQLLRFAVSSTPVDPVAGNPNSLMSQMGAADFGAATSGTRLGAGFGAASQGGRVGLGARFGSYTAGGYDTKTYTLPLSYSYGFSGPELIIDAPLTLLDTSGAQSYSGSLGVGVRVPMRIGLPDFLDWSLTPMIRGGAVGSVELGAVSAMWSASLTSSLGIRLGENTALTIGNMYGRLQTVPVTIQDYNISYELKNNMFRNGVVLTQGIGEVLGRATSLSVFAVDTRFSGDALFVRSYQEFGAFLNLGEPLRMGGMSIPFRIGATYTRGENDYRGFAINLGVSF